LHSQPTAVFEPTGESVDYMATQTQRRYAEIMRDVEDIINDHRESPALRSKVCPRMTSEPSLAIGHIPRYTDL
jgi:hypothetical protein